MSENQQFADIVRTDGGALRPHFHAAHENCASGAVVGRLDRQPGETAAEFRFRAWSACEESH